MLLLGIDLGTSSVKVSVTDADSRETITTVRYPEEESAILSLQTGWAEQSPDMWWEHVKLAILKAHAQKVYKPSDIGAIGIAYQMHGLVCVDKNQNVLRDSIIWCDSRAVELGNKAFQEIGPQHCLANLLNSPGNFTAAKLSWVKENEPEIYKKIDKVMLPGDFIAMKLSGEVTTSISALSEGVFWDFKKKQVSEEVLKFFGFEKSFIPKVQDVFSNHGNIRKDIADELKLNPGIPVSYKAGDQPNNALSLNVMEPGEVAATAGTSGVIYAVTDQLVYDNDSRINSFAHVNHTQTKQSVGVLLCINGTGIANSWVKNNVAEFRDYEKINQNAHSVEAGSEGLVLLPFGNGAERMLKNKILGAQFSGLDFNRHHRSHFYRAVQEGIASSFRFGLDIMRSNGIQPAVIRAGYNNMFLSDVFSEAFVNITGTPVELYANDGSVGAAYGAGIGAGVFKSAAEALGKMKKIKIIEPAKNQKSDDIYFRWHEALQKTLGEY